ncbi:MAG: YpdA family putative bacillithiol disulfide reductase [Cyclobacteriaceae bacterium]
MNGTGSYDILIVGAGPIGLACGIEAERAGLSYTIVEKGCLVNSLYHYPYNMTFFSTSDRLEIGEVPFISHGNKPTRSEALEYYRRVASSWKLKLKLYEKITHISREASGYQVETSRGNYSSKAIIVATGFYDLPYMLHVKGEELPKVRHYYDEPHPYFDQQIAVIGAANSAVDVALETYRKGAHVTMIMREKELRKSVKYWVRPDIENRIKEGSIKAYFDSSISEIREHEIDVETPDGAITLKNDFVLAMTGYQPDFAFLEMLGVSINDDEIHSPVYDPETHETNQRGIYLAGVICGGLQTNKWFIENSRDHAKAILNHIVINQKARA